MAISKLILGDYKYDLLTQRLFNPENKLCILRNQSLNVLHYLAQHANQTVSKAELFAAIWKGVSVTDDSLVQCIADIRRALQDQQHVILKTVARRGYVLIAHEPVIDTLPVICEEVMPLVGRHQELQTLCAMINDPQCRLITLVGLGGVGKSRLAKTLAKHASVYFTHGVHFIELASVQCPEFIPQTLATALGFSLQGAYTPLEQLQRALVTQCKLLILDNVEHLITDLTVCSTLLEACPYLKILTTSRLPLKCYGEWLYHLQGFTLPPPGEITSCAAVDLFIQIARRLNYDFVANATEQQHILAICRLVEGLPLGIEIAASWTKHLSCAEILVELRQHLQAASEQDRGDISALTQVLKQSWQMLTAREQIILQTLALFRGKFTRQAASKLVEIELADFSSLMDKSILARDKAGYYSLHEVMRQHASELRLANQQHIPMAQRFVEYHLEIAETVDAIIFGGQQLTGMARLESEHDNFRTCLILCNPTLNHPAVRAELGLKLVGSLGMFWFLANHWQEGYSWAEHFLQLYQHEPPSSAQVGALLAAGGIAALLDKQTIAEQYLHLGTERASQLGDNRHSARGLLALSVLRRLQGRYAESIQYGQQSMQLFTAINDEGGYQFNLVNTGHALLRLERYDEAIQALEECINLNQKIGLTISMPYALVNLGRLYGKLQQLHTARTYLQQSIQIAEQLGILLYRAQALCKLGWIELSDGNIHLAMQHLCSSMTDYMRLGDREGQIEVMQGIGVIKALQGNLLQAWQCLAATDNLAQHLNLSPSADTQTLLTDVKQCIQQNLTPSELALHRHLGLTNGLDSLFTTLTDSH